MSDDDQFKVWVSSQPLTRGMVSQPRGVTLKVGARVCKTAKFCEYGNVDAGTVSKRELTLVAAKRLPDGTFDFSSPDQRWVGQEDEIDKLAAFLSSESIAAGRYRLVAQGSPAAAIADMLDAGHVDIDELAKALADRNELANLLKAIVSSSAGETAAAAAVQTRRRQLIARLHELAHTPRVTETQMQRLIGNAYWLFGGRYVGIARRDLANLDQHDIPLMGVDGTLQLVELKGPDIGRLVHKHRNHYIVGNEVHEAVSQAMNYVRTFDEMGAALETQYRNERNEEWDFRRVQATVVIGHPEHVSDKSITERVIEQTIRSYNAHLSRVEVITYKSLFDAADRALQFTNLHDPNAAPNSAPLATTDPAGRS